MGLEIIVRLLSAVDGHWSSWGNWASCSTTCGNGTRTRTHTCVFLKDVPRGNNCTGASAETQDCNEGVCPGIYFHFI